MKAVLRNAAFWGFAVSLCAVLFLFSENKTEAQKTELFFDIETAAEALKDSDKNSPASVREARISFDSLRMSAMDRISIPLFDGNVYTAERLSSEGTVVNKNGTTTWRGKIGTNGIGDDVVLTIGNDAVNGLIHSPGGFYEIVTKGSEFVLIELDHSKFPDCAGGIKAPKADKPATENVGSGEDSGDRVDVLVVYTEAVKNAVGGDTQAMNLAQSAIDASNTAYINSKIRMRLRLVHSEQSALTEANSLGNLRADPTTQALRNTHNADMVAMLVNSLGGCGIGYVMTNVSSGFAPSAYSITLRTCAVGNLTFAHELGHNMGSTHDPANGGNAAFPYSYGHYVSGNYRSVMSYSNQCSGGCTRVAQFSSPSNIFSGVPTGVLGERNNARSLRNTADTVANFRYSGKSITMNSYSDGGSIPTNLSKTLSWSSNNLTGNVKIEYSRNAGGTWQTLIASTPNDGSQTFSISGPPTKQVRLRVTSLSDSWVSDSSIKNLSID